MKQTNLALISDWTKSFLPSAAIKQLPVWFQEQVAQRQAFWLSHGLPVRNDEAWKYLNLAEFEKNLLQAQAPDSDQVTAAMLAPYRLADCYQLVITNGRYNEQLSEIPNNINILSLEAAAESNHMMLAASLKEDLPVSFQKLDALNLLSLTGGIFIQLEKNQQLDKPLQIIDLKTEAAANSLISQRKWLQIEAGASLDLIETLVSSAGTACLLTEQSHINLADNSRCQYYLLQAEPETTHQLRQMLVKQAQDSCFRHFSLTTGGKLFRQEIHLSQAQGSAESQLSGLYLLHQNQVADHHLTVAHQSAHGQSQQHYRGIVADQAEAIFNSKVQVAENAKKINSQQLNKNLLLSPKAQVNTKPELEIYADDVLCAHGATVGQLDQEALFYLKSRGISAELANRMLTKAFCDELFSALKPGTLSEYLLKQAHNKINQMVI